MILIRRGREPDSLLQYRKRVIQKHVMKNCRRNHVKIFAGKCGKNKKDCVHIVCAGLRHHQKISGLNITVPETQRMEYMMRRVPWIIKRMLGVCYGKQPSTRGERGRYDM